MYVKRKTRVNQLNTPASNNRPWAPESEQHLHFTAAGDIKPVGLIKVQVRSNAGNGGVVTSSRCQPRLRPYALAASTSNCPAPAARYCGCT